MRWVVVIAMKQARSANTRLAAATHSPEQLTDLTRAMRADTISAVRGAAAVHDIVFVVDDLDAAAGEHVLLQRAPGLNAALSEAAAYAGARWPDAAVAALVADLPALRSEELSDALALATDRPCTFVADHLGTGTSMLTARDPEQFSPRFGAGSAAAHRRYAHELSAGPGLRIDVDTPADLRAAAAHGLGPATGALLPHLTLTTATDIGRSIGGVHEPGVNRNGA